MFSTIVTAVLKEWRGKYIICIIDSFNRYTRSDFVRIKNKSVVVAKIIELWLPDFGSLKCF